MKIELTASAIVPAVIANTGSFSRASTGTYFDAAGVMQTAGVDVPRIDYDPVTLECKGLLIEEARTNLLTYSEQLWNPALWAIGSDLGNFFTVTASTEIPDVYSGASSVAKFVAGASTSELFLRKNETWSASTYAPSIFIYVPVQAGVTSWSLFTDFADSTGSAVVTYTTFGSWVRVQIPSSTHATSKSFIDFNIYRNGASPTTGFTFYASGAQLEVGSVTTSYIPTTTTAVTRAADIITGSGLIYCSTPEPAAGETLWNAATSYTVGQVVARTTTHHLYENLIAGVDAVLPEVAAIATPKRWLDLGSTNRWAQFDKKIGTATTSTGNLTTVIKPGSAEGLALLDLVGRSVDVIVKTDTGGAVVLTRTIDLDASVITNVYDWMFTDFVQKRNALLTDLPGQYPNAEITVTISSTTGSAVGVLAVGRVMTIGSTQYGAGAGIINFGKVADDGFGNRTWIEGEWANRVTLPLIANTSDFNRIHRQLAAVRSTPCIYIGSDLDSMEPLVCYGVFRDLYITVPNHPTIALNLEIDGMNNS